METKNFEKIEKALEEMKQILSTYIRVNLKDLNTKQIRQAGMNQSYHKKIISNEIKTISAESLLRTSKIIETMKNKKIKMRGTA